MEFKAGFYRAPEKGEGLGAVTEYKTILAKNKTVAEKLARQIAKQLEWRFIKFC